MTMPKRSPSDDPPRQAGAKPQAGGAAPDADAGSIERDALLRAIVETTPDGLITIREDGTILSFNASAERMFGLAAAEVLGRNVSCLMPSPYREQHDGFIAHYLATGEKRIIGIGREVLGRRGDGSVFPLELSVCEVCASGRRFFAGFVRDVTQRRTSEQRLHELQHELLHVSRLSVMGEMASALAHELNQPLTAIINYAQASRRLLVASPESPPARIGDLLEKTVQQATRAGQIIHRLRQFIAKGETERRLEPVNQVVEEASALALVGTIGRGITVRRRLADGLPPVLMDKIQIHQVITNLIRNSVDALAEVTRREILIHTSRSDDGLVEIVVADTGPGLAPEVAARLFQPFVSTKPGGMGIGLSICRSIVDAHGGRLWQSENPGGGTAFHISLPTSSAHEPQAA
jgi:two-component system, LuxR family, sensor kinase FixL